MAKDRYEETMNLIREEFPGDEFKAVRNALYKTMYSFRANDFNVAPASGAVENLITAAVENLKPGDAEKSKIDKIVESLNNDRAGRKNLAQLVRTLLTTTFANKSFSAHDITRHVRNMVNDSKIELLDDRPYEEVNILGDGFPTALTQRIEHQEVRKLVQEFASSGLLPDHRPEYNGVFVTYKFSGRVSPRVTSLKDTPVKDSSELPKICGTKPNSLLDKFKNNKL